MLEKGAISKVSHSKNSKNKESVSGGVQSTRDNLVRTNTFVRNIKFHYLSYSPSTPSVSVSSTRRIATLKRSVPYMVTVTLNTMVKEELASWIKNFRLRHYSVSLTDTNADR